MVMLAASVGLSLTYWPGLMTWDSIRQYDQATSGEMDDWHPPAMEWIWRQLDHVYPGPASMLVLQLALYTLGFGLLVAWAMRARRYRLGLALAACSLMPLAAALMGEVLKDCLMAGALMAACGLMVWRGERRGWLWRFAGIALVALAAAMRFNAFLAGAPIVVALMGEAARRTPLRLFGASLAAVAGLMLVMPSANRMIGAEKSGVELSLIIFDLGGITEFSHQDAFPPLGVANPVAVNHQCYSPEKWDTYAPWTENICLIGFDDVRAWFANHGGSPWVFWAKAVLAQPVAYAQHRLAHLNINTRLFVRDDVNRAVQATSVDNMWHYQVTPSPTLDTLDATTLASANSPLGWPIAWMALALGVLLVSPRLPSRRIVIPLILSGLLYGLGYAVFSVASELRYYLWTYVAVLLATVIAAADLWAIRSSFGARGFALLAGPPASIAAIGAVWRLAMGVV